MSPRDKLHVMQPMRAFLRGSLVEHPSQRPRPKPRRPVCLLFSNLDSWDTLRFTILILIYPWKLTLQAVTPEEQEKKDFQKDLSQWCTQESMESFHYRFQGLVFLIGLRISQLGNKARLAAQALTKHGITNQEAITNVHIYIYIYTQKNQHILCSHGQALEVDPTYDFCNPCPTNPSTLQGDKDRIGGLPRKGAAILEEVWN